MKRLESAGYEIKHGKYISVRAQGQGRFTRTKTLGADYTEDAITKRIAGEYACSDGRDVSRNIEHGVVGESDTDIAHAQTMERGTQSGADGSMGNIEIDKIVGMVERPGLDVAEANSRRRAYKRPTLTHNLIVDINNCVKAQQSAGFARWQKIENLKEAARTVNFLTENSLLQYADLEMKIVDIAAAFDKVVDMLKTAEKRLSSMAALMKHIANYQQTKPIYGGMKAAKDTSAYRRVHESAVMLHGTAAGALRKHASDGGKLPNPAAPQTEYNRLMDKKNVLRTEYSKLKRQAKEYGMIKKNVNSIINTDTERARRKEHREEL